MKTDQTAPKNIDEYIAGFPGDVQEILEKIRMTIRKAAPDAEETIKYQMPTFTLKGNLVYFAAFKKHIGFYPVPTGIEEFKNVILLRLRFAIAIWPGLLLAVTTACSPEQTALSDAATATPRSSFTATVQCEQEVVPPQITEVRPAQAIPGSEISVIGSGGYVQDTCGGYSEGSKTFKLYLDNEPIGDLSCYINRCEKQLTLSSAISSGSHCLSVQKDECQFEIQVTTN